MEAHTFSAAARAAGPSASRARFIAAACAGTPALAGCELIGNVFEAGVWFGVIAVIAVIALAVWGVSKLFGR